MSEIAGNLVSRAELRVDLSALRVGVRPIEPAGQTPAAQGVGVRPDAVDALSRALQTELALALSARMSVIDTALSESPPTEDEPSVVASHLIVGDYAERGERVLVTIRLVEVDSLLIVATARGEVDTRNLVDPRVIASSATTDDSRSSTAATLVAVDPGTGASAASSGPATPAMLATSGIPAAADSRSASPRGSRGSAKSTSTDGPELTQPVTSGTQLAPGTQGARPLAARDLEGIGEPATARRTRRRTRPSEQADPQTGTPPRNTGEAAEPTREELVREAERLPELPTEEASPGPAARRIEAAARSRKEREKERDKQP